MGEQLTFALRDAIEQGRLTAGTRLPSSRELAADLGVSRGLVVAVYERLVAEGRLVARRGSGTVVTGAHVTGAHIPRGAEFQPGDDPEAAGQPRPISPAPAPAVAPLRPGVPDLGMFPRTVWRRAYERALTLALDADFDYGDPAGAFRLRAELAAYLSRIRAATVDVDRLVITTGGTQAIALIAQVLGPRCRFGVEDPGDPRLVACLAANGAIPVPIPVDGDGVDVSALRHEGPLAILVTPARQYPTGVVLAPRRRAALLEWARRTDAVIVENDSDAEFRLDRHPVGCLQGLAPERVILVGSCSGTLAPGLRLGWLAAPRRWWSGLCDARRVADAGGPILEQLAFAELLAGAGYDRHLRRARRVLRERRAAVVTELRASLPQAAVVGVPGGLHLTVTLPSGVDDLGLAERARAEGLGPLALSSLRAAAPGRSDELGTGFSGGIGRWPPGLVLGFAAHPSHELTGAVRVLAGIAAEWIAAAER